VHVEAGGTLNASLLAQGLVDELLMYVAPRLMGAGLSAAGFLPETVLDDLSAPAQWQWQSLALVGEDARLRAQKIRGVLA
jgi:diaminohydroxyphosphoribosylaminopyrimidine deaminase/5-amino-6-(5-phosphoribosylamino)uracil reductase